MRRFHGSNWSVGHDDPTWLAAQYLLAVPLARLLASPDWKALALHPQGNAAFVAEVRRTIDPDYVWNPYPYWRYIEPLARTLLEEREDAEGLATLAEYRRTHGRPEPAYCSRYTEAAGSLAGSVPTSSRNAWCRRPAGSPTGAGMRGYQFNKVEKLGPHYRTTLLATRDASASMRLTCAIEVWLPSIRICKEVSSASWSGDYQCQFSADLSVAHVICR